MLKFPTLEKSKILEWIKSTPKYQKSIFHKKIKSEIIDIKSINIKHNKRENELTIFYIFRFDVKNELEVVIDLEIGKYIFIGYGKGSKKASIASNPDGLTESIEEVVSVISNHARMNTFEKLKINKSQLKFLLENARDDLFDEELEGIISLRDKMKRNKDTLNKILVLGGNGKIKIGENGLPTLKDF